jgi:hypothetical protein
MSFIKVETFLKVILNHLVRAGFSSFVNPLQTVIITH